MATINSTSPWNPMPQPGIGNVGSYLIAGDPFLSSSNITGNMPNGGELKITFPRVTRSVTVVNHSAEPLYLHFETRANPTVLKHGYYVPLDQNGDAWAINCRCKEMYISMQNSTGTGSFVLSAELTNISDTMMYVLTGAGINA